MKKEIDLLKNYPKTKRDLSKRLEEKTEEDRYIARQFGQAFFDGDRRHGYGGFNYHSKFWQPVIPDFIKVYSLNRSHSILDIGCAKGFMLYDFQDLIPGISIAGIDISSYAIETALPEIKPFLKVGNAKQLPYSNHSMDLVISINTIHNLELDDCKIALKEIQRVSKGDAFITVDAYRTPEEKKRMMAWNLTAKTILSAQDWKGVFEDAGYTGDYYWFIP